jgi:hypothetical protein
MHRMNPKCFVGQCLWECLWDSVCYDVTGAMIGVAVTVSSDTVVGVQWRETTRTQVSKEQSITSSLSIAVVLKVIVVVGGQVLFD